MMHACDRKGKAAALAGAGILAVLPVLAAVVALAAGPATAEPYIAVRTGFKCSQCHGNRTGGGMRTEFGQAYSQYKLLMRSPVQAAAATSFDPRLNGAISLGGNFRVEQIRSQQYTNGAMVTPSSDNTLFKEANVYANVELLKGFLNAYVDETVAPAPANREMHATVTLPWNSWFKFGNMLLPYGFRLMDDLAFVRSIPNYNYNRSALGYEVGFEPGPLSLVANVGSENASGVGSLTFKDLPVLRTVRLGGSYGTPFRKREREKTNSYGVFGGFAMGMFTVLGERDWTKKDSVNAISDYLEVDFLPFQGLNFKAVYEYLWPDKSIPFANNGKRRVTVGAEPFVTQFLQLGLYYRLQEWIPQSGAENQDQIIGRLHVFF
jgi:hypothetical protein